jgi:hypothetical protein
MPATSTMGESGRRESNPHRELGKPVQEEP